MLGCTGCVISPNNDWNAAGGSTRPGNPGKPQTAASVSLSSPATCIFLRPPTPVTRKLELKVATIKCLVCFQGTHILRSGLEHPLTTSLEPMRRPSFVLGKQATGQATSGWVLEPLSGHAVHGTGLDSRRSF
ncbi:uncharacterized protein An03g00620 [Aspergillus niger]|uniref:Contig An03c0020, genomic contig n=2 Tax=Aspergillus niger TaxID=5061 RepID=A2QFS7_ASPNC|nr:uncharacterized protein An03g00620 [Aspergillus niger]CAK38037.1 unnamed protein product [Aspergillus niger]